MKVISPINSVGVLLTTVVCLFFPDCLVCFFLPVLFPGLGVGVHKTWRCSWAKFISVWFGIASSGSVVLVTWERFSLCCRKTMSVFNESCKTAVRYNISKHGEMRHTILLFAFWYMFYVRELFQIAEEFMSCNPSSLIYSKQFLIFLLEQ